MTSSVAPSPERSGATGAGAPTDPGSEAGAVTRAHLIKAGRHLFGKRGFDGASVRAITAAAGTNLGAITYHFGSKRGLYSAALEECLRPIEARVLRAAEADGSGLDRMLNVVEAYFDHFQAHPDLPHLLLQEVAAGKRPPDVVLDILMNVKDTISSLHEQGVADGSVRPGSALLSALSVVSQPVYLTLVAPLLRQVGGVDLNDPHVREGVLDHIRTFVRAGLESRAEA